MKLSPLALLTALVFGILVAPLAAEAQQPAKVRHIGILGPFLTPERERNRDAFRQSLRDLGWVEGQNLITEYRYAEGGVEQLPTLVAELVRLQVEVIVTVGGATRAAKDATSTIPIVMVAASDAVAQGLIASLAQPGGNITGLAGLQPELNGKRLELLKEAVPQASRIAVLMHAAQRDGLNLRATQAVAQALGVELDIVEVRRPDEIESAFASVRQAGAGALLLLTDPLVLEPHRGDVTALALQHRLPAMYPWRMYVDVGG
jgi:putative tryptophan/tyrosine transport system substrate-binding protein